MIYKTCKCTVKYPEKPEGTRGFFTGSVRKSCNQKRRSQSSKFITTYKYRIENIKISENMIRAQVQSGATAHQAMQPSRAERPLYDSYAQEFYGANSRLSLEKNHGQPFRKACSKSCGSSSAQGGHRIRLRPQWPGVVEPEKNSGE